MLVIQQLTYAHPDKTLLFEELSMSISTHQKVALVGNNGVGKSTLLQLIAGILQAQAGSIQLQERPYYVPQVYGRYNDVNIGQALGVADRIMALQRILAGEMSERNLDLLQDDWAVEERCTAALEQWGLGGFSLDTPMAQLSGGEKTRVFLAGIAVHEADFVLMDEPSNHLDAASRTVLYDYIRNTRHTLLVVSHDRALLNLLDTVAELSAKGISLYGGNYEAYKQQKQSGLEALQQAVQHKEKELRKAKEVERLAAERRQKLDARGKRKQEKAGVPTIMMNTLRNSAQKSTAKMGDVHADKVQSIRQDMQELRSELPDPDQMRIGFAPADLHRGKILLKAEQINHSFDGRPLWKEPLDFTIVSGTRTAITGANGSGKTTLLRMIMGTLVPQQGQLYRAAHTMLYIDQEYGLVQTDASLYELAQQYNRTGLQEHEIKNRLKRFLFGPEDWHKSCAVLSGGEQMRMLLCCLTIQQQTPDIIVLDEPTNNLDIQNMAILTAALNEYKGTLIVVSHDAYFLAEIGIKDQVSL